MDNFSARRNNVINFLDEVKMQREQEAHDGQQVEGICT